MNLKEETVIPDKNKEGNTANFFTFILYKYYSTCIFAFFIIIFIIAFIYIILCIIYVIFHYGIKRPLFYAFDEKDIPFLLDNQVFKVFINFNERFTFKILAYIAFVIIIACIIIIAVLYYIRSILLTEPLHFFIGWWVLKECPFKEGENLFKLIDRIFINLLNFPSTENGVAIIIDISDFIKDETLKNFNEYKEFVGKKDVPPKKDVVIEKFSSNDIKKTKETKKVEKNPYLLYYNTSYTDNIYENFRDKEDDEDENNDPPKRSSELICEGGGSNLTSNLTSNIIPENMCKCVNMEIGGNSIEEVLNSRIKKSDCFEIDCCIANEIRIDELKKQLDECKGTKIPPNENEEDSSD